MLFSRATCCVSNSNFSVVDVNISSKTCKVPLEMKQVAIGRTLKKLVNHELQVSDLQAFHMFSQHPMWVCNTSKLTENVFYCLIFQIGVLMIVSEALL